MSVVPAGINPKIVLGVLPETIVSVKTRFERIQPTIRLGLTEIAWPVPSCVMQAKSRRSLGPAATPRLTVPEE